MTNDDTLISRAQAGDEGAFTELMRAHYAFIYAIVIGIVNNRNDAEEVVQDTFLNAYRGLAQYEEQTKLKSWLAKIARNRALNWLREQRINTVSINEVSEDTLQSTDSPDEQLIRREERELIRRAMETLSQKDRDIARSYYLEGASYDELIRTHGLSYKAISFRLSRAKQKLAKRLGHLLTGVFASPITSLKQIYSGGLTVMKVGTVSKITAGIVAIIVLAFIGTRQFISSKEESSPSVEVVTSTPNQTANSVTQRDAMRKGTATAPLSEDKPQISAGEMEQIEDFFAQLDEADPQSETDMSQFPTDAPSDLDSESGGVTDSSVASEGTSLSAEEVMSAFVEAFRNLDFEEMASLTTGVAKEGFENAWLDAQNNGLVQIEVTEEAFDDKGVPVSDAKEMTEEKRRQLEEQMLGPLLDMINQVEILSSEHSGNEFRFRLKIPAGNFSAHILEILEESTRPGSPELAESGDISESLITTGSDIHVKMRKENGAWRIYEIIN